jgi:hypothetical protein
MVTIDATEEVEPYRCVLAGLTGAKVPIATPSTAAW